MQESSTNLSDLIVEVIRSERRMGDGGRINNEMNNKLLEGQMHTLALMNDDLQSICIQQVRAFYKPTDF